MGAMTIAKMNVRVHGNEYAAQNHEQHVPTRMQTEKNNTGGKYTQVGHRIIIVPMLILSMICMKTPLEPTLLTLCL